MWHMLFCFSFATISYTCHYSRLLHRSKENAIVTKTRTLALYTIMIPMTITRCIISFILIHFLLAFGTFFSRTLHKLISLSPECVWMWRKGPSAAHSQAPRRFDGSRTARKPNAKDRIGLKKVWNVSTVMIVAQSAAQERLSSPFWVWDWVA